MSELALAVVRGRDRRAPRRRAAQRALRGVRARLRRARVARAARGARLPLRSRAPSRLPAAAAGDPRPAAGPLRARRRGRELLARPAVAIVGARACSPYGAPGRAHARPRARRGRARRRQRPRARVDGEAHRGALEAGGATVAVLGCGIDRDYPAAHARARARGSRERASIVSEYAPGVEPAPWRFPARNRIVAGLCAATVVVEARERSGALITADLALEEGREVFAVPGEITSRALGRDERAAAARRDAAHLRRRTCSRLRPIAAAESAGVRARADGRSGARRVRDGAGGADELARATGLGAGELAVALTELELAARRAEEDGVYRACR